METPRIGLVLGSGAARGWAHIGVIEELESLGLRPSVVAGCSIGAVVGAAYVLGRLGRLKEFALRLDFLRMANFFDVSLGGGGMIEGERIARLFEQIIGERKIEEMPLPFGAVATDIRSGREVWLREGGLIPALRASAAIPGLFVPHRLDGRWLSDGGLVNPVPVSLARAMDAEIVIAVNVNVFTPRPEPKLPPVEEETPPQIDGKEFNPSWFDGVTTRLFGNEDSRARAMARLQARRPQQIEVINNALAIMGDRITKSRAAGEPPDVMLVPPLGELGVMQFDRAGPAIEAGRKSVRMMAWSICEAVGLELDAAHAGIAGPEPRIVL